MFRIYLKGSIELMSRVTRKQGGSGIGLAIVKKIVEDHKGKIWAESVEGEGTTMHLNLLKYNVQNPQPKE